MSDPHDDCEVCFHGRILDCPLKCQAIGCRGLEVSHSGLCAEHLEMQLAGDAQSMQGQYDGR